jgi:hypothetical protein
LAAGNWQFVVQIKWEQEQLAIGGWQLAVRGSNKTGINKENFIRLTLSKELKIIFRLLGVILASVMSI